MANLLANIFSAADSLKRAVMDAVQNPVAHAERTIGRGLDASRAVEEDLLTSATRSVLVPESQRTEAFLRNADKFSNQLAGAGIIVPVGAIPGMTRSKVMEISQQLSRDPVQAWLTEGTHRQPLTNQAVKNISDRGQLIGGKHTLQHEGQTYFVTEKGKTKSVDELIDISRYPEDLQQYFKSLRVGYQDAPGASYYQQGRIDLGPAPTPEKLTSYLLHELQHGSQYLYDMPRGGNPTQFFQDYGKFSTAKIRGEQLLADMAASGKVPRGDASAFVKAESGAAALQNPDAVNTILGMLKKVDQKAHSQYEHIAGEVEARLVQRAYESPANSYPPHMMTAMRVNPDHIISPDSISKMPKVDADPVTQALIRMLIGEK